MSRKGTFIFYPLQTLYHTCTATASNLQLSAFYKEPFFIFYSPFIYFLMLLPKG